MKRAFLPYVQVSKIYFGQVMTKKTTKMTTLTRNNSYTNEEGVTCTVFELCAGNPCPAE